MFNPDARVWFQTLSSWQNVSFRSLTGDPEIIPDTVTKCMLIIDTGEWEIIETGALARIDIYDPDLFRPMMPLTVHTK